MRLLALTAALCLGSSVSAQTDCSGDPGYVLGLPSEMALGGTYNLTLDTPTQHGVWLVISTSQGPTPTPFGEMCVGFPALATSFFMTDASGSLELPCAIPCDASVYGMEAFFQFAAADLSNPDVRGVSNQVEVHIVDEGLCGLCFDQMSGNNKPAILTMSYTGEDCSASNHSQAANKVTCSGDPALADPVRIIVSDKADLANQNTVVWFDGFVSLNGSFVADATALGFTKLKGDTYVTVLDLNDNVLQTVSFHTSCSQPLNLMDQFGSVVLTGLVTEE